MKKDNDYIFEEPLSKKHKNDVFNAVALELERNKKSSVASASWMTRFAPAFGALALAAVIFYQATQQNTFDDNSNAILELAALSPDELEIIEDLDFIEAIEELSPEELEEIM